MTLRVWGVAVMHYVGRHSIGFCLMFFSWLDWDYEFWCGRLQRLKCHSHHIISEVCTLKMTYHCWYWPWSSHWGSVCHTFPLYSYFHPPFYMSFFGRKSLCSPYSRCRELCSISLNINYLEISCTNLFLLHLFVYSVIYLS